MKFVQLMRVNCLWTEGTTYYYWQSKPQDDEFDEAKVYFEHDAKILHFIRSARHYPDVDPKFLEFDAPDASAED